MTPREKHDFLCPLSDISHCEHGTNDEYCRHCHSECMCRLIWEARSTKMATDDEYMCPFCVTPWKCNGPHIPEDELREFTGYMDDVREDLRQTLLSGILDLPLISVDGVNYIRRSDVVDICEGRNDDD